LAALRATIEGAAPEEVLDRDGVMLSQKDMALASALVYACLRHQSRLDFLIDGKLSSLGRTSLVVRIILRLGLAQLLFFDRVGAHAVVNEAAELTKKFAPGREGLVNAILRGFLREKETSSYFPREIVGANATVSKRLGLLYSYPEWLVEKLVARLGFREARAFLVASNQPATATIRVNPRFARRAGLAALFPFKTSATAISPWGLIPERFQGRPDSWPGFVEGLFSVQDEASQLLGLLAGQPRTIFDACAGMGGKSLALLALFPEANLLALDPNEYRLKFFREELKRHKLPRVPRIVRGDLLKVEIEETFDLVVVDAPCSGTGVIRRRPDLKWRLRGEDIAALSARQKELLAAAAARVAPGGRLVYAACSVLDEEGPRVMEDFWRERPAFAPLPLADFPALLSPLAARPGEIRLWPQRQRTDGFYYGVSVFKG
jgi:16S rRNA (cytosine967-C5)-methyltransferase